MKADVLRAFGEGNFLSASSALVRVPLNDS